MSSTPNDAADKAEPMDNVTKALSLARLGVKVFPVWADRRVPAIPGEGGVYLATIDAELIATWFTVDYVGSKYAVAAWMGGSGLLAVDPDRGKKSAKDGFKSLSEAGHTISPTHHYDTPSGGEHHIYATDRTDLAPAQDAIVGGKKLEGVDIRAAGSYVVWWGDVPESRDAFSTAIPEWVIEAATPESVFTGEGFAGSVKDWLEHIPDDVLPSGRVRDFMARIPTGEFGHGEMVELVWSIVRLGSERETGIKSAITKLRAEWLRGPYDTPKNRKDFYAALVGAINKGGRVQRPVPSVTPLSTALDRATMANVGDELKSLERKVSETDSEIDFARSRKEMFKIAADAGLSPSDGLGIVTGSKAFKHSKASMESVWFSDGEPAFHDYAENAALAEDADDENPLVVDPEIELANLMERMSRDAESYTFLSAEEQAYMETSAARWFGDEYLDWIKTRLKHYNRPYHVGALWAALSVIASPWGKVPLQGHKMTDVNLYVQILGESSSGKSEAWGFGKAFVDAFYGLENSPILGDTKKVSAISLHRTLILRDGQPSLVYSDEVQGFYEDLKTSHWQGSIVSDLSDYYGGDIPPKNTINDKEISGKRAKGQLTTYFTGIADMTLDALSLNNWRSGFLYRYLWGFGHPRVGGAYDITFEDDPTSYTAQMDLWAREFKRLGALQETLWGPGRIVKWEEDARLRMVLFNQQIDEAVKLSPLYDTVFIPANGRFLVSVMKCATIVALAEAAEKVTLRHVRIALSYAGPWHRSMVLAVSETGREAFDRDVERALTWIKRNAIRKIGEKPYIQRSAVMRAFKPNEVADRLLRQLTEEGWLIRSADTYQIEE
jgi:hypothetical protein